MAGLLLKLGLSLVVLLAVSFQVLLKEMVWLGFGIGKDIQPLSDFPYDCRRIDDDPRLQACEDMWLSEKTRVLYLACSDSIARTRWLPNNHNWNLTGRSQRDAIIALQIDAPAGKSFEYKVLQTPGYAGTLGDGLLDLTGLTGIDIEGEDRVELLVVNSRPSIDSATGLLFPDQAAVGGNSTVELFEVRGPRAEGMTHVHTFADASVTTPNNVALAGGNSREFYTTNDHGPYKVGLKSHLNMLIGSGEVAFCSLGKGCKRVSKGHKFPNGLAQHGGSLYVPGSAVGGVQVFRIGEDGDLTKIEDIPIDYGLDNLSVDANGDLYLAAFPKGVEIFKAFADPFNARPPSTVIRIRKGDDGKHTWEKVLEDAHGEALPGSTTALHDAKTGRLFLSSVISPFITVCEPRS
ncbi:related to serum paraoxonase/arylesterase [Cephalotrichum gorgonifer]|uniref:Related to serum paraoxonase/arylesterase n=1 Tax=Cephalotrichum gorgonifer TaxID=2041049 RepID=A0AAE8MR04_9PEZI|nr:related to serum paraoxonase/arylesterase [Cephalotrichum gorgonifer]